ncbi:MAG: choice-of-anchor B family protein [Bacteroidales bacterium]
MKRTFLFIAICFFSVTAFAQLNMDQLGHLSYNVDLSDVWGYVDENGNEYALVGTYNGLSIVDVTDPANPVEVFFKTGPNSIWRDIKTWGDYAYVSNEQDEGVLIVDLSPLPGTITTTTNFTGDDYPFSSIHNLYIDETGKLYIMGADNGQGGAIICDLTADPMNPVELGRFNEFYLHDGMARGDTLWGAGIYGGILAAIDVSDPANPDIMGTVSTPSQFCHNAWVSDDGTHVFTTDEVSGGFIGAFNVEDLSNMYETDRVQSNPGSDVIPHNAHVLNDFIITSYYADGITVHDASNPSNLIEVANYDTSPNYSGSGYNGSWGAYPFLPSGNILASDIENGLHILSVEYLRASFLEGMVTDSISGNPLFNVEVEIVEAFLNTQTAFDGTYEFGMTISGTFDIQFSKAEYNTKVIEDVEIINGEITQLDVELRKTVITKLSENDVLEHFAIYPNPFASAITLEYKQAELVDENLQIHVFNSMGNQVSDFKVNSKEGIIRFGEDLPAGIYFLQISSGNQESVTRRIIKL